MWASCGCGDGSVNNQSIDMQLEHKFMEHGDIPTVLFMVNPWSGSGYGPALLSKISSERCPFQGAWASISLAEFAKEETLPTAERKLQEWIQEHPLTRIVVAGGDGSVKWVVEILSNLELARYPPLAVMPVGTGNELSRVSGWGIDNIWGTDKLDEYCNLVINGAVYDLDMWDIQMDRAIDVVEQKIYEHRIVDHHDENPIPENQVDEHPSEHVSEQHKLVINPSPVDGKSDDDHVEVMDIRPKSLGSRKISRIVSRIDNDQKLIGFFTLGLDAKIGVKYHKYRSQVRASGENVANVNKSRALHAWWAVQMLTKRGKNIHDDLDLYVDGTHIPLPKGIQNLMFHNIHSSSGGTFFWSDKKSTPSDRLKEFSPLSTSDGKIEVSSIRSVTHLVASRIQVSHAIRLAQGSRIELRVRKDIAAQLDGEPWIQPAGSRIVVSLADQQGVQIVGGPRPPLNMYKRSDMDQIVGVHSNDKKTVEDVMANVSHADNELVIVESDHSEENVEVDAVYRSPIGASDGDHHLVEENITFSHAEA